MKINLSTSNTAYRKPNIVKEVLAISTFMATIPAIASMNSTNNFTQKMENITTIENPVLSNMKDCFYGLNLNKNNRKKNQFKVDLDELANKAKKTGFELKYTMPNTQGKLLTISNFTQMPKELISELKNELKSYDDNKNNQFDKNEIKTFFEDALNAVNKTPSGYNFTTNFFVTKCPKTCSIDEALNQTEIKQVATATKTRKVKTAEKQKYMGPSDTTYYIYQPRKDEFELLKNKTYSASDINPVMNLLKKYDKASLKKPNNGIRKELAKMNNARTKTRYDKLKAQILQPILKLKPDQKIVFMFNMMENNEPVRGKIRNDHVYIYTIERKHFNRIKVTNGLVEDAEKKAPSIFSKIIKKK